MQNLLEFASKLFLFSEINQEELCAVLDSIQLEIKSFSRTESIYSPVDYEKKIGFVVSGRCEVRCNKGDGSSVVLNILSPTDSFGVLAIFSDEEFPTEIYASKNSEILFIGKTDVLKLIEDYPKVSMNFIKFMANRIKFLNGKISTFSGTRVEDRLASFLLSEAKKSNLQSFSLNCKKCAEAINAGRASVYRAIETLSSEGLIIYENKKINVLDPQGLERISK